MPDTNSDAWNDHSAAGPSDPFNLGTWLGRWQALGFVAGRCSAADVDCLREIRERKLYRSRARTWAISCSRYLGLSRAQADRLLQYLAEFGPNYFHLTATVRVSPQTYRAISHAVRGDAILHREIPVALIPENAGRILRAVRELRRESLAAARALLPESAASWKRGHRTPLDPKALRERTARLAARLGSLVQEFAALAALGLDPAGETILLQAVQRAIGQLTALKCALRR